MIFQKKIIIGSVMSFIATAIGVIAVFFPDLLNLQKEKMERIEISISTRQDVERFIKFVDERTKDHKIFEADITVTYLEPDEERFNPNFPDIVSYISKKEFFGYTFNNHGVWVNDENAKFFSIDIFDINKNDPGFNTELGCVSSFEDSCDRTEYLFPMKRVQSGEVINGGARIRGYFMVNIEKTGGDATANWVYFDDIPKEQIQLKNY